MSVATFALGQSVKYTDRQGVVTLGTIDVVEPIMSYADPTVVANVYYGITGLGVLVADGIEAIAA